MFSHQIPLASLIWHFSNYSTIGNSYCRWDLANINEDYRLPGSPSGQKILLTQIKKHLRIFSTTEVNLEVFGSPGLGQTVRISEDGLSGYCLLYEGEAIHLSLF